MEAPQATSFELRVADARALAPSVRELTLERVDGMPIAFTPGQWVNLFLPGPDGEVKRSYSIASAPDGSPRAQVAVTRVDGGVASALLHDLPIGGTLRAAGPHGFFTRAADDPAPALLVATGTGLAPIRSIVAAALAAGSTARLWILFGVRHEEDILWRDELQRWTEQHPAVRVEVTLSRPHATWAGRRGWVQDHLSALWHELGDPTAHVWVCGLERMVKAVRELARGELGVDRKRVHQEKYD
jgi:CDP-4-dehydro-6-deoxyglucose reductase